MAMYYCKASSLIYIERSASNELKINKKATMIKLFIVVVFTITVLKTICLSDRTS